MKCRIKTKTRKAEILIPRIIISALDEARDPNAVRNLSMASKMKHNAVPKEYFEFIVGIAKQMTYQVIDSKPYKDLLIEFNNTEWSYEQFIAWADGMIEKHPARIGKKSYVISEVHDA